MAQQHGEIIWTELNTRDIEKAKTYYAEVCGWTFETVEMEHGEYHIARLGDQMVAGMMDISGFPGMEETPAHWLSYIEVSDVDKAAQQTRDGGGTVYRDPWDIPTVGRIAIVADPTGAAFGLMTSENG